jgi:hypothetical protein
MGAVFTWKWVLFQNWEMLALPGEETGKVLMVQNDETRALNNLQDTEPISRQCNKLKVERSS